MECKYKSICNEINCNKKECLKILHYALADFSWKKRAIYKYEALQQHWDRMDLSMQLINPIKSIDNCDDKRDSVLLPVMYWQKPLFFDLKIRTITKDNIENTLLPSRLNSGILLSKLLVTDFRILRYFKNNMINKNIGENDIILFLASIFISSGKKIVLKKKDYKKTIKSEIADYIDFDYIKENNLNALKNQIENVDKTVIKIKDYKIPDFIKLPKRIENKINENDDVVFNRYLDIYDSYSYCNYALKNIQKEIKELFFPIISLRDYLYLHKKFDSETTSRETINNYMYMLIEFSRMIDFRINETFFSNTLKFSNYIEIKEILCLWQFFKQYFIVFADLPANENEYNLKINFTAPCQKTFFGKFNYPISVTIANSVHLEIITGDVGYSLKKLRKKQLDYWGRNKSTGTLLHLNSRKNSPYPFYIKDSNNYLDNLYIDDSIKNVRVKYKLSDFLNALMLFFIILMLLSIGFVSNDSLTLFSCVLPLVSIILTLFAVGKWSLTHYLMRKYKIIIFLLSLGLCTKYFIEYQMNIDLSIYNIVKSITEMEPKPKNLLDVIRNYKEILLILKKCANI